MINEPFKRERLRESFIEEIQDGLRESLLGNFLILDAIDNFDSSFSFGSIESNEEICLLVNCDLENRIPILMIQEGYEWVPVYTRKLF